MKINTRVSRKAIDIKNSAFKDFRKEDWVMVFIEKYGFIDGAHHKDWLLEQVVKILKGGKITGNKCSQYKNGEVTSQWFEFSVDDSDKFLNWTSEYNYFEESVAP